MSGPAESRGQLWEQRGLVEDLLARAMDDWLDVAEFSSVAKRTGVAGGEGLRALAIGLVAQVLVDGLMMAGDVGASGFSAWHETAAEAVSRIVRLWDPDDPYPTPGSVAWLSATAAGELFGNAVLLRESGGAAREIGPADATNRGE